MSTNKMRSHREAYNLESDIAMAKTMMEITMEKKNKLEVDGEYFEELRIRAKTFMKQSTIGFSYDTMSLLISAVSCLQFIYSTYLDGSVENETIVVSNIMELIFASVFAFDWLLSFFLADHKVIFCTRLVICLHDYLSLM